MTYRLINATQAATASSDLPGESDAKFGATPRSFLLAMFASSVLLFLCLPILIVVPMSFSSARSLHFPPPSLSLRWYEILFSDRGWIDASVDSLVLGTISSCLGLVLGTMAAYGIVRGDFLGKRLAESNFVAPIIVPSILTAVALYIFLAKVRLLGTFFGLALAHTLLVAPYPLMLMSVAIQSFDIRIEQAALTLGASKAQMLLRVLLPNLVPSAAAAWIFAFIVSFDEVVVTQFICGTYFTIPKKMFNELILQINPTITAVATLLIAISVLTAGAVGLLASRSKLLWAFLR